MIRILVVVASLALGCGFATAGCSSAKPPAAASAVAVASAKPGVDHAALLALAGSLVGGADKLADPATGRLPDIGAFRTVGIATLTVSGSTIRVVFLSSASAEQRQAVERTLRSSPLIETVSSQ